MQIISYKRRNENEQKIDKSVKKNIQLNKNVITWQLRLSWTEWNHILQHLMKRNADHDGGTDCNSFSMVFLIWSISFKLVFNSETTRFSCSPTSIFRSNPVLMDEKKKKKVRSSFELMK